MASVRFGFWLPLAAAAALATACGNDAGRDGDPAGGGADAAPAQPDASTTAASCERVDVLISVDGSSSMSDELLAMRDDVFPAFATRLRQISDGLDDFRVATIDACPTPPTLHTRGKASECSFEGGNAWIDSTSSAMDDEFACVGDIFQGDTQCSGDNDDEQPVAATIAALTHPGNAGFLRDDALLVVVAITDEDEQPTGAAQSAAELFDALTAVKGGDPKRMVLLGIGGSSQCDGVYGSAKKATKLAQLTELFDASERGVFWDLCEGRLEDGLSEALAVIETACDELPLIE